MKKAGKPGLMIWQASISASLTCLLSSCRAQFSLFC